MFSQLMKCYPFTVLHKFVHDFIWKFMFMTPDNKKERKKLKKMGKRG